MVSDDEIQDAVFVEGDPLCASEVIFGDDAFRHFVVSTHIQGGFAACPR